MRTSRHANIGGVARTCINPNLLSSPLMVMRTHMYT